MLSDVGPDRCESLGQAEFNKHINCYNFHNIV